jgi:undecaprenyl-diphosphatase
MWFFRADWIRIIRGFARSLPATVRLSLSSRRPRLAVVGKDERLAWMIVFATIPVGLAGVVLERAFRVLFAKPIAAACLLFINGLILLVAEDRRRSAVRRKQNAARPAPALVASGAGLPGAGLPGGGQSGPGPSGSGTSGGRLTSTPPSGPTPASPACHTWTPP